MNWLRYALIAGICLLCYLLFLKWNDFEQARLVEQQSQDTQTTTLSHSELVKSASTPSSNTELPQVEDATSSDNDDLPTVNASAQLPEPAPKVSGSVPDLIEVETDSFKLLIDNSLSDSSAITFGLAA